MPSDSQLDTNGNHTILYENSWAGIHTSDGFCKEDSVSKLKT